MAPKFETSHFVFLQAKPDMIKTYFKKREKKKSKKKKEKERNIYIILGHDDQRWKFTNLTVLI